MKKIKLFTILVIMCIVLCSCEKTNKSDKEIRVSSKTDSNQVQPLNYTVFPHYNDATKSVNSYFFETNEYVFYRNNADNGYLYRINKKNNNKKVIFNKNENYLLSNIKVANDKVYFVAKTAFDTTPTLYSSDIDGNNFECLVSNVGEYVVSSDCVYYVESEMMSNLYVCKYTFQDKMKSVIYEKPSNGLNLVGKSLYFVSVEENSIIKLELDDLSETKIPLAENITGQSQNLFYYDNSFYFKASIKTKNNQGLDAVVGYNLKTCETEIIADISLFENYTEKYSQSSISQFVINPDRTVYISLWCVSEVSSSTPKNSQKVFHLRNGEHELCVESDQPGVVFHCEGKLLLFNPNNSSDALIIGSNKYN